MTDTNPEFTKEGSEIDDVTVYSGVGPWEMNGLYSGQQWCERCKTQDRRPDVEEN